jgi:hypothetical protein
MPTVHAGRSGRSLRNGGTAGILALLSARSSGARDRLSRARPMTAITYRDDRDLALDPLVALH